MLSYSSLTQVKAGLFIFGFQILMCMVNRAWHHLMLPRYQVQAQKYGRARLPRPCRPPHAQAKALTQAAEPTAGTALLGCILHLRITQRH